jgi:hypothetical protein
MTMASGTTLLNQNSKFCADTLHVVGLWYDPTTCKVSALRMGEKTFEKKKATFDHFVRSQATGGAQDGQNIAQNWIFSVDTLRVVGSYHDPTACKVSASRTGQKLFGKTKTMFYHFGLSQDVGAPIMAIISPADCTLRL